MEIGWLIAVIVFAVGGYFSLRKWARISQALACSLTQQSIAPILQQIHALPPTSRPDHFHRAISHFWKAYERPLAADLIRVFLAEHPEMPVVHFWIQEMMTIEPALGKQTLSEEALEKEFRPELAACCGPVG